jgi:drug/metabolite transporter (DMT)-like permease
LSFVNNRSIIVILGISGILLFSTKAIFAKLIYAEGVDHMTTLMLRMLFATPVYIVILAMTKKGNEENRTKHGYLFLLGFLGYYVASYLDFTGLTYIKASLERLILFVYPTLVIFLSALFLKKYVSSIQKVGVLITYVGILVVFFPELISQGTMINQSSTLIGGTLVFFSALTYAGYLVGSQWLIPSFGVRRFTAIAMIWSGLMVTVHYLFVVPSPMWIFELSPKVYGYGIAMGIISTILPSFLISQAIHKLGAAQFSIFGALGPVSTITLAFIFLGERLTLLQILGSIVVISGVMLAEYYGKRQASKVSP